MNKTTYIHTDNNTVNLAELLLAKLDNHYLDMNELMTLVRTLIPSQEPEHFYTSEETAKILCISVKHLFNLRIAGEIHYREIGTSIRYSKSDIEEYQAKCKR
jgi:hypothetical protein